MGSNTIRALARQAIQVTVPNLRSAQRARWFSTRRQAVNGEDRMSTRRCQRTYTYRSISTGSDHAVTSTLNSSVPTSTDLLELYRGLVAQGRLKWDDDQVRCVLKVCPESLSINLAQSQSELTHSCSGSFDICWRNWTDTNLLSTFWPN